MANPMPSYDAEEILRVLSDTPGIQATLEGGSIRILFRTGSLSGKLNWEMGWWEVTLDNPSDFSIFMAGLNTGRVYKEVADARAREVAEAIDSDFPPDW